MFGNQEFLFMVKENIKPDKGEQDLVAGTKNLVVHNDDFNTFDFVIQTLIDVCKHDAEQAQQCTLIIHYNGKCIVRSGDYYYLGPMYREILNRGITATIE